MKLAVSVMAAGVVLFAAGAAMAAGSTPGVNRVPQPNIMNPAGMGNVPPSAYSQTAKNARSDIYAGGGMGNLIVTGDVGGGRQFRGVVPYSSVNSVGAPTGNTTYSSFMKNTEPQALGAPAGTVKPYYVPANTVSKIPAPGTSSIAPPTGRPLQPAEAKPVEFSLQDLSEQYRPLSRTSEETVDVILKQYPASQTETSLLKAINDMHQKELAAQVEDIKKQAADLAQRAQKSEEDSKIITAEPEKALSTKPYEPLTGIPGAPVVTEKPVDIYDKMLQQLDKDYDDYMKGRQEAASAKAAAETAETKATAETGTLTEAKESVGAALRAATAGKRVDPQELYDQGYKLYMDLGNEYMKQKKFYKAAETYALARTYHEKAESFAAQGWALLGTGEYMSSAYYLGRSIELDPSLATKKVDLTAMLGSDTLAQRITDLDQWQQRTYSGEMQFLLGYIYYEMGKGRDAEDQARAAAVKLADYRPAAILKEVITGTK